MEPEAQLTFLIYLDNGCDGDDSHPEWVAKYINRGREKFAYIIRNTGEYKSNKNGKYANVFELLRVMILYIQVEGMPCHP